jgi:hypothetical protein
MWHQPIEGVRVADLKWGTANAVPLVVRFWFRPPSYLNKTFGVAIRNGAQNRSYVTSVTFDGSSMTNPDQQNYFTLQIPGDKSGGWPTDNTVGMHLSIVPFAGANVRTTPGAWAAGNFLYPNAGDQLETMGANANPYRIGNVEMYADPNNTGVAPEFVPPLIEDEMEECLRYWYKCTCARGVVMSTTQTASYMPHFVPMRVAPASAVVGALRVYDSTAAPNLTGIVGAATVDGIQNNLTASGLIVGRPATVLSDAQTTNYIAVSARM